MHKCTQAFNHYPENKLVADRYAIVMGSSHCEPLLRNNVGEWNPKINGDWNYQTNSLGILNYWEERLQQNGGYDNLYTLGMRGVHDGAMPFKGTPDERIALMEKIIADQRALLLRHVNPRIEQVPQAYFAYSEMLDLYRRGLRVPDDVTLVWANDNHGYIRRLPTPAERQRSGGSGIYYHVSYYGGPEDYLWLCTTPPAHIWSEMHKAYDHGARNLWVLNVGDIKPAEIAIDFFLRLAWDPTAWNEDAQPVFLTDWANQIFGPEHATQIASILEEYYRLNFPSRPEHLIHTKFTRNYGEIDDRLARFDSLVQKTNTLYARIPSVRRDAFFQLVVYPVRAAALMNQKHLTADADTAESAHDQIEVETRFYNQEIAGGKWNHMMSANPRGRAVFKPTQPKTESTLATPASSNGARDYIAFEAERPSRAVGGNGTSWKTIAGLGRSGDSTALLPTTVAIPSTAVLEYDFTTTHDGPVKVLVYALPTHPIHEGLGARYSVAIDDDPPHIVDQQTTYGSPPP